MTLDKEQEMEAAICELLEMIHYSMSYQTTYLIQETNLYEQSIVGMNFAEWLYDDTYKPEIRDIKRELSIWINQSSMLSSDYNAGDEEYFIVGKDEGRYAWNVRDYLSLKQERLKNIQSRALFTKELQECFFNIFFDETVNASLGTLGKNFNEIAGEIVYHLQKLDEFHEIFQNLLLNKNSFQMLADSFTKFSGISCSPQAGRSTVSRLKREFYNHKTEKDEIIICELHTKFNDFNRGRQKPDRLYFHPGKPGIQEGRMIVIHIGEHL